jgi:hypothetical protein
MSLISLDAGLKRALKGYALCGSPAPQTPRHPGLGGRSPNSVGLGGGNFPRRLT